MCMRLRNGGTSMQCACGRWIKWWRHVKSKKTTWPAIQLYYIDQWQWDNNACGLHLLWQERNRKSLIDFRRFEQEFMSILFVFEMLSMNTKWWTLLENLNKSSKLSWNYFVSMWCVFKVLRLIFFMVEQCGCKVYVWGHTSAILKVYIKKNYLQLELIRCSKKMFTLFTFTFAKRRIQCNIAHWLCTKIWGHFEHKPDQSLSFLNSSRGLKTFILYFSLRFWQSRMTGGRAFMHRIVGAKIKVKVSVMNQWLWIRLDLHLSLRWPTC